MALWGLARPQVLEQTAEYRNQHGIHAAGVRCPACEAARQGPVLTLSPALSFREAFDIWIADRILDNQGIYTNARFISPRTERDLRQYADAVDLFFRNVPLSGIHSGRLRAYQKARAVCDRSAAAWKERAGANLIRKEIGTLVRVMKVAGAWNQELDANYEPLQMVESDEVYALTPDEQHRWLHTAAQRRAWRVVYWYSLLAFQTTASTNELRALRLADVDLHQGTIRVRREGAKNKGRIRMIPLVTPEVAAALHELVERAKECGAEGLHCYLFPRHIAGKKYDPLRPMSVWGLRKPWDEVRDAAQLPAFTPYHTRHTGLTRMAEAGVPVQVAMSFAGHMSPRMQQRYIAIGMNAKHSAALAAFAGVQWNGQAAERRPPQPVWQAQRAASWG